MVIVISGATSGIGKETALLCSANHHQVYSLSRRCMNQPGIRYLSCDISKKEDIHLAVEQIIAECGTIDVLINNAGIGSSGAFELQPDADTEKLILVNTMGALWLSKECIPYLKKSKGKIINISSVAGKIAIPFQTIYSMTKSALISFSEGLHNELRPFGVKVCCILPGDIKTEFTEHRMKTEDAADYHERIKKSVERMEKDERHGMAAKKIAKKIYRCIEMKNPPLLCTVGFSYRLFLLLEKILPARLVYRIIYQLYGK